jgi:catechol 2,3-dioxygenase-like lactoylglutathione lyase family enzyme
VDLERLDHIALWVADRDAIASFAQQHLGMHVIERTDRFTLVGAHARHGKLTLFEAEPGREPGALAEVGLRVNSLEDALAVLPDGSGDELDVGEGLRVRLVEAPTEVEYDLHHVALRAAQPEQAVERWQALGLEVVDSDAGVRRLEVAGSFIDLWPGEPRQTERPLLNHLGVLVESADAWRERAEDAGAEVVDIVDAPNTYAVFVLGPEQVKLEYVEHKPSFALE